MEIRNRKIIIGILIVLFIIIGISEFNDNNVSNDTENLKIYFFDVGQGDSSLIRLPNSKTLLIDGGSRKYGDIVLKNLENLGINKIDYLIATHPHEDHIGGLTKIIDNINIGEVYLPKKTSNTKTFEKFLLSIDNKGVPVREGKLGVEISKDKNLLVDIIGPSREYNNTNNNSIILRLKYKKFNAIFMGDGEKEAESDLIDKNLDIKSQVIKIGHHGSKTSTSIEFIERVKPKYSFISLGKDNKYNHPDDIIIERLKEVGSKIFRTDIDGNILLNTDGESIRLESNIVYN